MAKDQDLVQGGSRRKAALVGVTSPLAPAASEPPKKRVSPMQFLREVRAEARKVTWTSWKETWITSIMVGIMVVLTAAFFYAIDGVLKVAVDGILHLASGE